MSFICFPDLSSVQDLPFYTVSVGLHYWQYPTERPDGYAYPQFLYSSQGQGILTTEGYTIEIPPRSIIYSTKQSAFLSRYNRYMGCPLVCSEWF